MRKFSFFHCCLFTVACSLFFTGCGGGGGGDAATTSSGSGAGNPVTSTSCASGGSTGNISVSSKPSGASIYIDGADTGQKTPVTVSSVTEGLRTVKLSYGSPYQDSETTVCVSASSVQTVSQQLALSTDLTNSI